MNKIAQPVNIEVFYPFPESYGICLTCESIIAQTQLDQKPSTRNLAEYPPEWQVGFSQLSDLILTLSTKFQNDIIIHLWDPRSLQGMCKSLRYRVHQYPVFVINKKTVISGLNYAEIEKVILRALSERASYPAGQNRNRESFLLFLFMQSLFFLKQAVKTLWITLRDILYGATIYEMVHDLEKERGNLQRMFILVVFGDFLGIPIIPPYYTLRLIPFIVPEIGVWQRSVLRERDLTDLCDQEIT